jgi:hypothetical protein
MRSMTKSPVALAQEALKVGESGLSAYSSRFSKKTYTQPQLFAILVLRLFFRTDYRGVVQLLKDLSDLRQALQIKHVPHYSTLCYAEKRLIKKGLLKTCSETLLNAPEVSA